MSFSDDLLSLALDSLSTESDMASSDAIRRRAVSTAYYGLFHRIAGDAAAVIAPNVPAPTNHRIQRWFEHAEMKKVCGRFLSATLDRPLRDLIGLTASVDMQKVTSAFVRLQDARHSADYDLSYQLNHREAWQLVLEGVDATVSWDRIKDSAEANVFILSLLMWKNWEKER